MAGFVPMPVPRYIPLIVVPPEGHIPEGHRQLLLEYNQLIGGVNRYLEAEDFVTSYRWPAMQGQLRVIRTNVERRRDRVVDMIVHVFTHEGGNLHPNIRPPHRLNEEVARILHGPRLVQSTANALKAMASNSEDEAARLELHVQIFPNDARAAVTALQTRADAERTRDLVPLAEAAAAEEEAAARAANAPANIVLQEAAEAAELPDRIARRNQSFQSMASHAPYPPQRRRVPLPNLVPVANEVQAALAGLREAPELERARGRGRGRGRGRRGRGGRHGRGN